MRNLIVVVTMALVLSRTTLCPASVLYDRIYHLGENDVPPAVAFGPGDPVTVDSMSGVNASKIGLEFYHGQVSGGGPPTTLGIAPGSTVAMEFTNVDSRYVAPISLGGVTQFFGMEGYVQVSAGVTGANWFYNGGPGFPLAFPGDGYGLGVVGGQYAAIVSGSVFPTGVLVNPLQPVEMALVNTGGVNFSVYIQHLLVTSFADPSFVAPSAADVLSLGNFNGNSVPPAYSGVIDEARTFSYLPGQFDPNTDLGAAVAAVPEPSALILTAIGVPLIAIGMRRASRANVTAP
jgi:hypothetical protein